MNPKELYLAAIQKWGLSFQYVKLCEEIGELLQAASKVLIGKWHKDRLAEEIADVEIMLEQVKVAYNLESHVLDMKEQKLKRLERRLKK